MPRTFNRMVSWMSAGKWWCQRSTEWRPNLRSPERIGKKQFKRYVRTFSGTWSKILGSLNKSLTSEELKRYWTLESSPLFKGQTTFSSTSWLITPSKTNKSWLLSLCSASWLRSFVSTQPSWQSTLWLTSTSRISSRNELGLSSSSWKALTLQ